MRYTASSGPNGAGESTAIRVLLGPAQGGLRKRPPAGLLKADSASARLLGKDPWHDATELHARLAYVPGDVSLWPGLSGGETIDLPGRLRGGLDAKRRKDLLERFDLDPTKKGRTYSAFVIQATLRLRADEVGYRAEPLLATRVGRVRWGLSHLLPATVGAVSTMAAAGGGADLMHGMRTGDIGPNHGGRADPRPDSCACRLGAGRTDSGVGRDGSQAVVCRLGSTGRLFVAGNLDLL